jgi:hypothetical protein
VVFQRAGIIALLIASKNDVLAWESVKSYDSNENAHTLYRERV